ncbi:hypothetical protein MTO96_008789 [Rhipicephalus appendiculatus]
MVSAGEGAERLAPGGRSSRSSTLVDATAGSRSVDRFLRDVIGGQGVHGEGRLPWVPTHSGWTLLQPGTHRTHPRGGPNERARPMHLLLSEEGGGTRKKRRPGMNRSEVASPLPPFPLNLSPESVGPVFSRV